MSRARKNEGQLLLAAARGRQLLSMLRGEAVPLAAPIAPTTPIAGGICDGCGGPLGASEGTVIECAPVSGAVCPVCTSEPAEPATNERDELADVATLATLAQSTAAACERVGACIALVLYAHDGAPYQFADVTEAQIADAWRDANSACGVALAFATACERRYPLLRGGRDLRHIAASNTRIAATLLRWHTRELVHELAQSRGWTALAGLSKASSQAT